MASLFTNGAQRSNAIAKARAADMAVYALAIYLEDVLGDPGEQAGLVKGLLAEVEAARLSLRVVSKALVAAVDSEHVKGSCSACAAHYGDQGPCDDGKPVAAPHRSNSFTDPQGYATPTRYAVVDPKAIRNGG